MSPIQIHHFLNSCGKIYKKNSKHFKNVQSIYHIFVRKAVRRHTHIQHTITYIYICDVHTCVCHTGYSRPARVTYGSRSVNLISFIPPSTCRVSMQRHIIRIILSANRFICTNYWTPIISVAVN